MTATEPTFKPYWGKSKHVVLITGAASGIGAALAEMVTRTQKYRVVLTARQKSLSVLRDLYQESENLKIKQLDLTNLSEVSACIDSVVAEWSCVDILVNNAGICFRSVAEQMDADSEFIQMQTNYLGPMALIRSALPIMRERGYGKIVNVSSASGIMGMPTMGSYSASKQALEGASESLWYELKPFGIAVSVVRPGFINSEGHTHTLSPKKAVVANQVQGVYSDFNLFMARFVSLLMTTTYSSSRSVAKKIFKTIESKKPPLWVDATLDSFMLKLLKKIIPDQLFHLVINSFFLRMSNWGKKHSRAHAGKEKSAA
jgi:short-subunit dehydrogenase